MTYAQLVPAAQYVRMSTDEQKYSIRNQKAAISEYAHLNGFEVVQTYEDPGESGLSLNHRNGLRRLLADAVGGGARYKTILVLDVSRWGRFQDPDEAAHYEFVCKRAGIRVVYCAEEFNNQGDVPDYFAKVLKRTAAAEYVRELSIKSFENHKRTVLLGFRVGSEPGYGFRRMAVGRDGRHKGILNTGQYKTLMSDRVTLVHGPEDEVDCVRLIFSLCLKRKGCPEIAYELNRKGIKNAGREWKRWMVEDIVKNPKYAGTYRWNQSTQRLHSQGKVNDPKEWITKANAFPPIVPQRVFARAQLCLRKGDQWSERELWQKLKQLLAKKGYLSERLIQSSKGMPSLSTFYRRLGTFEKIYERVGYTPHRGVFIRSNSRRHSLALRAGLLRQIEALFPGRTSLFHVGGKMRQILKLDGRQLSIVICRSVHRPRRAITWSLIPVPTESQYLTLVCRLNSANDGFHSFYMFRRIDKVKPIKFTDRYPWLSRGQRVRSLEELCQVAARLLEGTRMPANPQRLRAKGRKGPVC